VAEKKRHVEENGVKIVMPLLFHVVGKKKTELTSLLIYTLLFQKLTSIFK